MRVRVRFRFDAATGEVETFVVEDVGEASTSDVGHDAVHDRVTADVARVIEQHALFEQFVPDGSTLVRRAESETQAPDSQAEPLQHQPGRTAS